MEYRQKAWLAVRYIDDQMSGPEIAELCGVSCHTIYAWMKRLDIPRRSRSNANRLAPPRTAEMRQKQSASARASWAQHPEWRQKQSKLTRVAWERGDFGGAYRAKHKAIRADPAFRANLSEHTRRLWESGFFDFRRTGRGGYGSDFSEAFKIAIRKRDNYTCQVCREPGKSVHHIDYDKGKTTPGNCITLCRCCHSRTGGRHEYWQAILEGVLIGRTVLEGSLW